MHYYFDYRAVWSQRFQIFLLTQVLIVFHSRQYAIFSWNVCLDLCLLLLKFPIFSQVSLFMKIGSTIQIMWNLSSMDQKVTMNCDEELQRTGEINGRMCSLSAFPYVTACCAHTSSWLIGCSWVISESAVCHVIAAYERLIQAHR
jgi:hypothetical protein